MKHKSYVVKGCVCEMSVKCLGNLDITDDIYDKSKIIIMKKRLQKIGMTVAAIVLFAGVMLLSVEKNDSGGWEFKAISTYAQGETEPTVCDVYCQPFPGLGCRVSYGQASYTCWHMEPKI